MEPPYPIVVVVVIVPISHYYLGEPPYPIVVVVVLISHIT